jgi:hypothetical protein
MPEPARPACCSAFWLFCSLLHGFLLYCYLLWGRIDQHDKSVTDIISTSSSFQPKPRARQREPQESSSLVKGIRVFISLYLGGSRMEGLEEADDWQLIQHCLRGNGCAWNALVERKTATLFILLWYYLGAERLDLHLLEDLAQAVWFRLLAKDYEQLQRYQQEAGGFNTYLRQITPPVLACALAPASGARRPRGTVAGR